MLKADVKSRMTRSSEGGALRVEVHSDLDRRAKLIGIEVERKQIIRIPGHGKEKANRVWLYYRVDIGDERIRVRRRVGQIPVLPLPDEFSRATVQGEMRDLCLRGGANQPKKQHDRAAESSHGCASLMLVVVEVPAT